jgi:hypothetical protein
MMGFNNSRFAESAAISAQRQRGAAGARRSRRPPHTVSPSPPSAAPPARRRANDPLGIEAALDRHLDRVQEALRQQQRRLIAERDPFEEQALVEPRLYISSGPRRVTIGMASFPAFRQKVSL